MTSFENVCRVPSQTQVTCLLIVSPQHALFLLLSLINGPGSLGRKRNSLCSYLLLYISGFMEQLRLWKAMGFRLDDGDALYREFRAFQSALVYEETGYVDGTSFAELADETSDLTLYRCRKCRGVLASSKNTIAVTPGPGPLAFSWRKRDKEAAPPAEPSVFVEPLAWMSSTLSQGETQGKLYCPKCTARIGSYNWAGTQNSSGRWVVPAFQLHSSKLDIEQPLMGSGGAPTAGIPQQPVVPRLLPQRRNERTTPAAIVDTSNHEPLSLRSNAKDAASRQFTHLIFDCDGVMVDSEPASCEALRLALVQASTITVSCVSITVSCGGSNTGCYFPLSQKRVWKATSSTDQTRIPMVFHRRRVWTESAPTQMPTSQCLGWTCERAWNTITMPGQSTSLPSILHDVCVIFMDMINHRYTSSVVQVQGATHLRG